MDTFVTARVGPVTERLGPGDFIATKTVPVVFDFTLMRITDVMDCFAKLKAACDACGLGLPDLSAQRIYTISDVPTETAYTFRRETTGLPWIRWL